jgi:hypothetical protein
VNRLPGTAQQRGRPVRRWPLLVLAMPAAVAVWSGWVGIGQMTGFGVVHPFPGIADSVRVNTAFTLPLGVEAYAAYALRSWLSGGMVSTRTRRFAFWSAIGSFLLGMAGQVAYQLLVQAGMVRAPWVVTTLVSCLPVLVLGMGAALAHMLHADAYAARNEIAGPSSGPVPEWVWTGLERGPDQGGDGLVPATLMSSEHSGEADHERSVDQDRPVVQDRSTEVRSIASRLAASGRRVSRRTLRAAGARGSNAELGSIARLVSAGATTEASVRDMGEAP